MILFHFIYLNLWSNKFATPTALSLLSTLECGINYDSEITRTLGVSRQMVTKTIKVLCLLKYLEQVDAVGKQKNHIHLYRSHSLI